MSVRIDELECQLKETISKNYSVQPESINLDSLIIDDLGLDSFAVLELLLMKQKISTEIPREKFSDVRTVRNVIKLFKDELDEQGG